MEESLRLHADAQAAVQVCCYVVVPLLPRQSVARAALAWARRGKLPTAPLGAAGAGAPPGGARASRARRRAALRARGRGNADRAARRRAGRAAAVGAVQPDQGRHAAAVRALAPWRCSASSTRPATAIAPARRRSRLREQIAQSSLDFRGSHQHVVVDRDVEQTILVANTAGRTHMGWLHGAMLTRQPFTLSRVRARARASPRAPEAQARLPAAVHDQPRRRAARPGPRLRPLRAGARVPASCSARWPAASRPSLFRVSIYQTLRARGPEPEPGGAVRGGRLLRRIDRVSGDCKVSRGEFRQHELWPSSLPLGRDVYAQARKYPTVNAGDMLPLVGTKCGSPTGIPFAFADPGRTVELLNPYDEEHANHTLVIAGRSGSGKTMTANISLSRCLAVGARAFVIDRAGHYETLTRLVDGAQQIEIGADDSPYALNPWDVPGPGEGLAGEDRVPARAAPGDDGRPGRPADRDDRRRDPRRVRQGGRAARQPAARVDAPGRAARPGAGGTGRRTRSTSPRRFATSPTACPSTAARAPTPTCSTARRPCRATRRWSCSTRAAARTPSCELVMFSIMEYITDHGRAPLEGAQGGREHARRAAVPRAARSC